MKLLVWGIYLITFCLPLYLMRFKFLTIPTTFLEISIYVLFAFWLIQRLVTGKLKNQRFKKIILAVILIFIGVSLATIFSSDLKTSAGIWKAWFIDPLLFFIVLVSVVRTNKQIKGVMHSLFLSGAGIAIISLIYLTLEKMDPAGRLQAIYNSPNYLAMYLAPALIIGFWIVTQNMLYSGTKKRGFLKIYPWILTAIIITALLFTNSYGAYISIILAIGIGLLIKLFKPRKRAAWGVLITIVVLIVILGAFSVTAKSSSLGARLIIWEKGFQIYVQHPVLGIGPGTFGNYFPPYPQWGVPQPHNIFLAFLIQTGVIGFLGFIWLLVWFFKTGFKKLKSNPLSISLISLMSYTLIHGLVDTTYWKNDLAMIFWIITGLMLVLQTKD